MSCTFDELFFYLKAMLEAMPKPDKKGRSDTPGPPKTEQQMTSSVERFAGLYKMPIHEFKVPKKE